ncbi:MAG TPA: 4-hydroxythreonine-4-phosphate dehydrogenase PdxA [Bacteroidia bacterium]|nr:4-hydroxythreonine-4-phosphate dehydrogenase PdxA [Bacteroidia bacterium]
MSEANKIVVGITQGDFNGIGPEVIIRTLSDPMLCELCTPVVFSSQKVMNFWRKTTGLEEFNFQVVRDLDQLNPKRANLFSFFEEDVEVEPGKPLPLAGKYAIRSVDVACEALLNGKIDVLVTAPLDKNSVAAEIADFNGHTEYLRKKLGAESSIMLLVNEDLRVGLVTDHVPLREVAAYINKDRIVSRAKLMAKSLLEDFGVRKPKIAVLGLNPHAGDGGTLGKEELEIIAPAVAQLRSENVLAFGPYSADGFFGSGNYRNFDGILAMYHDQGLGPFKTLSFSGGVNFTGGMKYVRTSPDHGTGYDIAGRNEANESSFRQAVFTAIDVFRKRNNWEEISADPLKPQFRQKESRER